MLLCLTEILLKRYAFYIRFCIFFRYRGADVNIKDYKGSTPLKLARRYDQPEIEAMLVSRGAKDEQDQGGWTRTCA